MKNVKVILWGLGAMGGGIGKMLTKKKGVDIVGAIDIGDKIGKSLYDVVPGIVKGDREDVIVGTPEEVIKPGAADIVVVCTNSFTKDVFDKLVFVMERGMNVITSAEEMAYPQAMRKSDTQMMSIGPTMAALTLFQILTMLQLWLALGSDYLEHIFIGFWWTDAADVGLCGNRAGDRTRGVRDGSHRVFPFDAGSGGGGELCAGQAVQAVFRGSDRGRCAAGDVHGAA